MSRSFKSKSIFAALILAWFLNISCKNRLEIKYQGLNRFSDTSLYGQDLSENDRASHSAINLALAQFGKTPESVADWQRVLGGNSGDATGLLIPFSSAPSFTSLEEPRIVLTPKAGSQFRARLYVAISTKKDNKHDMEFISWNRALGKFDFGRVKDFGDKKSQKIEFANFSECSGCHRSGTPIFPSAPWDNSVANRAVLGAFVAAHSANGANEFQNYSAKLQPLFELDTNARLTNPIEHNKLIDPQMMKVNLLKTAHFFEFPFIDPSLKNAFDFDASIVEAQALAFTHEWLQTLPNQDDAYAIAKKGALELIKKYPKHYLTVPSYKNPRFKNYNLVVNKDNTDHALENVNPNHANIQAVFDYNEKALAEGRHDIPDNFKPSNRNAFIKNQSHWTVFFDRTIFENSFQNDDPTYRKISNSPKALEKHACLSCHTAQKGSPKPFFGNFDPLVKSQWDGLLATEDNKFDGYTIEGLLCLVINRIESTSSPMPPKDPLMSNSFSNKYQTEALKMLKSVKNANFINCKPSI